MNNSEKRKFFGNLVEQGRFVMKPNPRKMSPKHPDLIGYLGDKKDPDKIFVIYGWVVWSEADNANILRCVMSLYDEQNNAQKKFNNENSSIELPEGFNFEGEDLPV